jgi:uncharacterized lipoprotein YmbA
MRSRLHPLRRPARALRAGLVLGVLVLVACGTPPPTHFHSLMPTEIAARSAAPAAAGIVVRLDPIRVPAQLGDDSMAVLEQERWASPLRDELQQALLEELIVGQGAIDARTQPAPGAAATRVAIDVRRFDSLPGREARIQGSWTITGSDARRASRCEWLIREPAPGSFPALAAAHRRAVVRLGAAIGQSLARLQRGEAAACPSLDSR